MIIYRSRAHGIPPELAGWQAPEGADFALCSGERDGYSYCGIAVPLTWSIPPSGSWFDIGNGFEACMPVRPHKAWAIEALRRDIRWARQSVVQDADGYSFLAPVILGDDGERAYICRLGGENWLPMPTDEQAEAEKIARASRYALTHHADDTPKAAICTWAAKLLALTHHLSVRTIAGVGMMDEKLAISTLKAADSMSEEAA